YYAMNSWSQNPWTDPMIDDHNGDLFMLYPPSETNTNITYGSNNHRMVPSMRFELMRDGLEDYEYLYNLNNGSQPQVNVTNGSDSLANKIIKGLTSYTRDDNFNYTLRKLIGQKLSGEISEIPDIEPPAMHPRSEETLGSYYINFQDPDETFSSNPFGNPQMKDSIIYGTTYRFLDYQDTSYFAIGADAFDEDKGFGWYGNIINYPVEERDEWGDEKKETKRTYVGDDYGKVNTFEFMIPNGQYNVTLCVGRPRSNDAHNKATIEGIVFVNDEPTNDAAQYITRTHQVTVADNSLTVEIGLNTMDEYTMLDYMLIEAVPSSIELELKVYLQGAYRLEQNFPNPFNPETKISYYVPKTSNIKIEIYNSIGQLIKTIDEGIKQEGNYEFTFDATDLSSGVYFYKLKTDKAQIVKKMIYLK
ncbi:MAG: DUF4091 domain-containing protein, partial [Ignavibacteriales bacterium]|nr:DUF4091 domain-containing protein [Ignavibacteriales bacterium]